MRTAILAGIRMVTVLTGAVVAGFGSAGNVWAEPVWPRETAISPETYLKGPSSPTLQHLIGRARVIDGDTLQVDDQRVRLHGIDAPELRQNCERNGEVWQCGAQARDALEFLVSGQTVDCDGRERDRNRRLIAVCRVGDTDLGQRLVAIGMAVAFRRYSADYVATEDRARAARSGMWSGVFQDPHDYRATRARSARPPSPREYPSEMDR